MLWSHTVLIFIRAPLKRSLQIVIIGDEASGKTSVFEALTGLSFPGAKRPLTNFAIHAQFKRTTGEKSSVRARICPGPLDSQYEAAVEHLESFEVIYDGDFTGDVFVKILHEVSFILETFSNLISS